MKTRPEVEKVKLAQKIAAGKLVSEDVGTILNQVESGSFVIELGGIGAAAEYLATTKQCNVRLCEETRLYFVFRRNLLPKSTVVEINMDPKLLNYSKPYYDVVIISSPVYLETARKLAKTLIINTSDLSLERVNSAPDNTTVDQPVTEDVATQEITGELAVQQDRNDILDWGLQEGP